MDEGNKSGNPGDLGFGKRFIWAVDRTEQLNSAVASWQLTTIIELSGGEQIMAEVEIVNAFEVPSADPNRRGKNDLRVDYSVDGRNFYSLGMPLEDVLDKERKLLPEKILARIRAAQIERMKIVGQKLSV